MRLLYKVNIGVNIMRLYSSILIGYTNEPGKALYKQIRFYSNGRPANLLLPIPTIAALVSLLEN